MHKFAQGLLECVSQVHPGWPTRHDDVRQLLEALRKQLTLTESTAADGAPFDGDGVASGQHHGASEDDDVAVAAAVNGHVADAAGANGGVADAVAAPGQAVSAARGLALRTKAADGGGGSNGAGDIGTPADDSRLTETAARSSQLGAAPLAGPQAGGSPQLHAVAQTPAAPPSHAGGSGGGRKRKAEGPLQAPSEPPQWLFDKVAQRKAQYLRTMQVRTASLFTSPVSSYLSCCAQACEAYLRDDLLGTALDVVPGCVSYVASTCHLLTHCATPRLHKPQLFHPSLLYRLCTTPEMDSALQRSWWLAC